MRPIFLFFIGLSLCLAGACNQSVPNISKVEKHQDHPKAESLPTTLNLATKQKIVNQYKQRSPNEWGEQVTGVKKRLQTKQKGDCFNPRCLWRSQWFTI